MATFSLESKATRADLDNEFIFLAQLIRSSNRRVTECDREKCEAWLQRLLSPACDGTCPADRNAFLAELLMAMQSGELSGPFACFPPQGPLIAEFENRRIAGEPEWLDTVVSAPVENDVGDADERTYIATQVHPDGQGMYAYLAVSTADKAHWIGGDGEHPSCIAVANAVKSACGTAGDCESCSNINPSFEFTRLPCTNQSANRFRHNASSGNLDGSVRSHSRHFDKSDDASTPLMHFYDELLSLVDCVLRTGSCADDAYICQLVKRMKDQTSEPALLHMNPEQLRGELLRRLKAKLLTRRELARRGKPFASTLDERGEQIPGEDCPLELDLTLDEELWESAARRELSSTNMALLESVYPLLLVERFVNALIRERCSLISRMRAEHEVLVSSLRNDLEKDVTSALDKYRDARALWVLLLRATQEMQHIRRSEMANETDSGFAVRETLRELHDAMLRLDEEGGEGANLASQLVAEHQDMYSTERDGARHSQRLLAENDGLRLRLQALQSQQAAQRRRIDELNRQMKV